MPSVTLRQVRRAAATGRIYLRFTDKVDLEFNSDAEAKAWVGDADADQSQVRDFLRRLIVAWWLRQNPAGNNPALVEGKTITLRLIGTTLVEIT